MTALNGPLASKKDRLAQRAVLLQRIRAFFSARGYLEVETPHRIPANAPEPHIHAVASENWVLQTSPELAMKRLVAAGYDKVFQLCRAWRGEELGQYHLPEFTLLEWYRAGIDYRGLMAECQALLQSLVPQGKLVRNHGEIDLSSPWEVLTVAEAFSRYASMSPGAAMARDCFEEILTRELEPHLGRARPTFLIEYPAEMAALARLKPGNPQVAERFELYIDGIELANAFSELTDAQEQRRRFAGDVRLQRADGASSTPLPEKFLDELSGMPETAGIALGCDRLVMLVTGAERIDQVVAFAPADL